jgi:hypothetical protein
MSKKEKCTKCGSTEYAVATDKSKKHYCAACKHVWVPGLDGLTRPDLLLKKEQTENIELKAEIAKLRKEIAELREKYEPKEAEEIFD